MKRRKVGIEMLRIDTNAIEGYEKMTAEEKLSALESYELSPDGYVKKDLYDKTASDVAKRKKEAEEWKQKHNALLSEDEQKQAEKDEALTAMQKELENLRQEKTVSEHKAGFLGLGYSDELALETAKALATGDTAKVIEIQKQHQEALEQKVKEQLYKSTPEPKAGGSPDLVSTRKKQIAQLEQEGRIAEASALKRQFAKEEGFKI